jgi:ABC-type dipeptide/oligopeptide/nickel transport system permease component
MTAYIIRRLALFLPMAAGLVVVTFSLMLLIPGDPAAMLLGQDAAPDQIADLRRRLGLDDPWPVRLGTYFWNLLHGDLGRSLFQNAAVSTVILQRLAATLELAIFSLLVAVIIGVTLGVVAAAWRGSIVDVITMMFAQLAVSMPIYWMGILLMLVFAVQLNWLPSIGRTTPLLTALVEAASGRPAALFDSLAHLIMPAITLGTNAAAIISRLVRASMLEIMGEDFVRTAYAKGLRRPRVLIGHVLRNALLPIVSVIGLRFGPLLGGAVLTESIFGWPGLGQLTITAISQRDLPLVQGVVLTFALMFAVVNLIVDLLYAWIDPRIRLG